MWAAVRGGTHRRVPRPGVTRPRSPPGPPGTVGAAGTRPPGRRSRLRPRPPSRQPAYLDRRRRRRPQPPGPGRPSSSAAAAGPPRSTQPRGACRHGSAQPAGRSVGTSHASAHPAARPAGRVHGSRVPAYARPAAANRPPAGGEPPRAGRTCAAHRGGTPPPPRPAPAGAGPGRSVARNDSGDPGPQSAGTGTVQPGPGGSRTRRSGPQRVAGPNWVPARPASPSAGSYHPRRHRRAAWRAARAGGQPRHDGRQPAGVRRDRPEAVLGQDPGGRRRQSREAGGDTPGPLVGWCWAGRGWSPQDGCR